MVYQVKKKEDAEKVLISLASNESDQLIAAISKQMAIIQFKPDGTILEANSQFLSTMGYDLTTIVGKNHSIFCTSEKQKL